MECGDRIYHAGAALHNVLHDRVDFFLKVQSRLHGLFDLTDANSVADFGRLLANYTMAEILT